MWGAIFGIPHDVAVSVAISSIAWASPISGVTHDVAVSGTTRGVALAHDAISGIVHAHGVAVSGAISSIAVSSIVSGVTHDVDASIGVSVDLQERGVKGSRR